MPLPSLFSRIALALLCTTLPSLAAADGPTRWTVARPAPLTAEPEAKDPQPFATLPVGTAVELTAHRSEQVQVRTADGTLGWTRWRHFKEAMKAEVTSDTEFFAEVREKSGVRTGQVLARLQVGDQVEILDPDITRYLGRVRRDGKVGIASVSRMRPAGGIPAPAWRDPIERWFHADHLRSLPGSDPAQLAARLGPPLWARTSAKVFYPGVVLVDGGRVFRGLEVAMAGGVAASFQGAGKSSSRWVETLPLAQRVRSWDLAAPLAWHASLSPFRDDLDIPPGGRRLGLRLLWLVLLLAGLLVPAAAVLWLPLAWKHLKPLDNSLVVGLGALTIFPLAYGGLLLFSLHLAPGLWVLHLLAAVVLAFAGMATLSQSVESGRCPHCHAVVELIDSNIRLESFAEHDEMRTRDVKVGEVHRVESYKDAAGVEHVTRRERLRDLTEEQQYKIIVGTKSFSGTRSCPACRTRWGVEWKVRSERAG